MLDVLCWFCFFYVINRRPPISTLTDTRIPYTTRCRSVPSAPTTIPRVRPPLVGRQTTTGHAADRLTAALTEPNRRLRTPPRPREPRTRSRADEDRSRSEEHTSELQSLMRISYAVSCFTNTNTHQVQVSNTNTQLN